MAANRRPPPLSIEGKESEMVHLAVGQAEEMLRNHTAPAPVVVHYLKLGTREHELKLKQAELDLELTRAKTEEIRNAENKSELYQAAIAAMGLYRGNTFNE